MEREILNISPETGQKACKRGDYTKNTQRSGGSVKLEDELSSIEGSCLHLSVFLISLYVTFIETNT